MLDVLTRVTGSDTHKEIKGGGRGGMGVTGEVTGRDLNGMGRGRS